LSGEFEGLMRLRAGNHRVVFEETADEVIARRIRDRKNAFAEQPARWYGWLAASRRRFPRPLSTSAVVQPLPAPLPLWICYHPFHGGEMSLRNFLILLAAAAAASWAFPQSLISFEVASIKPSGPQSVAGTDGGPGHKDSTRYTAGATSLRMLIAIAWDVDYYFQIESPVALDKQNFDLVAKVPEGATKEQFRVMLQNLLKERFALKMHIESREFPAYELQTS
jgi:hypothetical protein